MRIAASPDAKIGQFRLSEQDLVIHEGSNGSNKVPDMADELRDSFDKPREVSNEARHGISFRRAVNDCPGPIKSFRREVSYDLRDKFDMFRDTFAKRPDMATEAGDGISFR